MAISIRRIRCTDAKGTEQLAALRATLSAQGEVVSARGRELTKKVFGELLPPARVVERICADVRTKGLAAVLHYTEQLDHARLTAKTIRVSADELAEAHKAADETFLETIRRVRQ